MRRAVMLDVYGTLVHDDREAAAVAAVAGPAGLDPAVVAADWDTRIWALADTAHGAGFLTLDELNVRSLTATAAHFGAAVDVAAICRRLGEAGRRATAADVVHVGDSPAADIAGAGALGSLSEVVQLLERPSGPRPGA